MLNAVSTSRVKESNTATPIPAIKVFVKRFLPFLAITQVAPQYAPAERTEIFMLSLTSAKPVLSILKCSLNCLLNEIESESKNL